MNGSHDRIANERVEPMTDYLLRRGEPATAIEIADELGIPGSRETRRRRVREVVDAARLAGHRVCAHGYGCWLARDAKEWDAYRRAKKAGAKFMFVADRRNHEAAVDRGNGQGTLFAAGKSLAFG